MHTRLSIGGVLWILGREVVVHEAFLAVAVASGYKGLERLTDGGGLRN